MNYFNFDIVINNTGFFIKETFFEKENYPRLDTLNKIRVIIEEQLEYSTEIEDKFSNLTKENLNNILKEKCYEIVNDGLKSKKFDNQKEKLVKTLSIIEKLLSPPDLLPLNNESIQEIISFLQLSDLANVACLNKHGEAHAVSAMLVRARKLGYEGNDPEEAKSFLKDFFIEFKDFCNLLPEKCHAYKNNNHLDYEKILKNINLLNTGDIFNIFSNDKWYHTVEKEYFEFPKILKFFVLKSNWDKSLVCENSVNKALYCAALFKKVDIFKILFNCEPDQKALQNVLNKAVEWTNNIEILELLLKHGANPNIQDKHHAYSLNYAIASGKLEKIDLLLKNGADPNAKYANQTMLMKIFLNTSLNKAEQTKIIESLLKHGANPNIPDHNGFTVLHYAAQRGNLSAIELLLKHGAKINDVGNDGATALNFACGYAPLLLCKPLTTVPYERKVEVITYLLEQGADPTIAAHNGSTPYQNAVQFPRLKTCLNLLRTGSENEKQSICILF